MEQETENLDSTNEETTEQETENVDALKSKAQELSDKNRQLYERAKKAETELKDLRSKAESQKPESQSTEPDYGRLAFLAAKQITEPDDIKLVSEEANRLKLPLTDVLGLQYVQAKLEENRTEREAKSGMPTSRGRTGGQAGGTVEYWLNKGGLPDDQELAEKVVNARMDRARGPKFSDELFTG